MFLGFASSSRSHWHLDSWEFNPFNTNYRALPYDTLDHLADKEKATKYKID